MNTDQKLIKKGLKMACFDFFHAFIGVNWGLICPFLLQVPRRWLRGLPTPLCGICVICGSFFP